MKLLLIGPYPPPHGGVSVHMAGIQRDLTAAGICCGVLDTDRVPSWAGFGVTLANHALLGWTFHVHTNGHNRNSWLLALGCGLIGQSRGGCVLTLHSGIAPAYLAKASASQRRLAKLASRLYTRIICVNPEIRDALALLGVPRERIEIVPAYLAIERPAVSLDEQLLSWIGQHQPLFSTALFFRAEYGFDLLVNAMVRLRRHYPSLGCLVMGSGEHRAEAEQQIRANGLEGSVLMLGDVAHEACLAAMSLSDVFLRTTLQDGDSISVREALSLGVPVVASRTGTRPPGTILFHPGNLEELLSGIELAMVATRNREAPAAGCMDRLMEIYAQVVSGEAYASV